MPIPFESDIDLKGALLLNGSAGTSGQIPYSSGPGSPATWADPPSGTGSVSIGTTAADVLSATSGVISADDAGADKLVFWDDSEGKLTHLGVGSGLSISGTTLSTNITTSTLDPTGGNDGDIWIKYTA